MSVALLLCALLIGGGGNPLLDLIVELLGALLLALVLGTRSAVPGVDRASGYRLGCALALLIALLPLLQLIPLPAALWRALPGREIAIATRDAIGAGGAAFPLSLDPEATWRGALYLVPAIALFLTAARATLAQRRQLAVAALCAILAGMLLGILQLVGGHAFYPFRTPHEGNPVGLLLNRNHEADLLLAGIALLPALPAALSRRGGISPAALAAVLTGVAVLLALCVVTTISRAGTALMPLVLASTLLRLWPRVRHDRRTLAIGALAALGLVLAALLLAMTNAQVMATIGRYTQGDVRTDYWRDTLVAVRAFWPIGSGIGTFVPVYAAYETLDTVVRNWVNHAHNDYLELVLEAGVAAPLLMLLAAATLIVGWLRRPRDAAQPLRTSGFVIMLVLAAHSAVDYPLRILALITLFGLAAGLALGARAAIPHLRIRTPLDPL